MARPNYQIPLLRQLENRLRWLTGHPHRSSLSEIVYALPNTANDIRTISEAIDELDIQMRNAMRVDL